MVEQSIIWSFVKNANFLLSTKHLEINIHNVTPNAILFAKSSHYKANLSTKTK